jgi:hypothetical protein
VMPTSCASWWPSCRLVGPGVAIHGLLGLPRRLSTEGTSPCRLVVRFHPPQPLPRITGATPSRRARLSRPPQSRGFARVCPRLLPHLPQCVPHQAAGERSPTAVAMTLNDEKLRDIRARRRQAGTTDGERRRRRGLCNFFTCQESVGRSVSGSSRGSLWQTAPIKQLFAAGAGALLLSTKRFGG